MGRAAHRRAGRHHVPASRTSFSSTTRTLEALGAEIDAQAGDRRDALVRAGELPEDWPLPYDAAAVLADLREPANASRSGGEDADAGYTTAPSLPGRADRAGAWLVELASSGRSVVVTTDQASRIGELLEEAGRPTAALAELRAAPSGGAIGLVHGSLGAGSSIGRASSWCSPTASCSGRRASGA